jgi:hypothetical protein
MGHFLWDNNEDEYKYHLANWQMVAQKKKLVVWCNTPVLGLH